MEGSAIPYKCVIKDKLSSEIINVPQPRVEASLVGSAPTTQKNVILVMSLSCKVIISDMCCVDKPSDYRPAYIIRWNSNKLSCQKYKQWK